VTLRIEQSFEGGKTIVRLSGRIRAEDLEALKAQFEGKGRGMLLDLKDVALVDVAAVRFLGVCESDGIELTHCSPYIRGWIIRERDQHTGETFDSAEPSNEST
jgi:hypothetical protein